MSGDCSTRSTNREFEERTSSFFPMTTAQGRIAEVQPAPSGDGKLFMNLDGGKVDFYDLLSDPAEETNLAKKRPKAAAEMKRQLKEWFATTSSGTLGKSS